MFLLDTVIISEIRKEKPDAGVLRWISEQQDDQLYLSVVTLEENELGIEKTKTRNRAHFKPAGVTVLNPFKG